MCINVRNFSILDNNFTGRPFLIEKNNDGVINNHLRKGNRVPQFDFVTFLENSMKGAIF